MRWPTGTTFIFLAAAAAPPAEVIPETVSVRMNNNNANPIHCINCLSTKVNTNVQYRPQSSFIQPQT